MDKTSKRIVLLQKEGYQIDLEYNSEYAILHLPSVKKFTRDVYLDMRVTFEDIIDFLKDTGYENLWVAVEPTNSLIIKFASRFGFEYEGSAEGLDVHRKELV